MSNLENEALREKLQDQLDGDLFATLLNDCKGGAAEFLYFLDAKLSKPNMDQLINEFLWTKPGQSWYAEQLEKLYNSQPENDENGD